MFTIWGSKNKFCDGLDRRSFLKIGAFGAGLTLADMLRLKAQAAQQGRPSSSKSVIMVFLGGGPPHMDMWDLKPDAPQEFRGEFSPIQTNVAGCQICELFPMQAQMWDKLAAIRSVVTVDEHSDAMVMTGHSNRQMQTTSYPSFGSVVSYMRGYQNGAPPFVSLRGMSRGTEPGYLGIQHRPFTSSGPGLENLTLARGINEDRLNDRRNLRSTFDSLNRELDQTFDGMDQFSTQAFDLVASGGVRNALNLNLEEPRVRDRYRGNENFLRALRLVEAGASCVTLGIGGWDTHSNNFTAMRRKLPELDRGIANLVSDLHARGLYNDTITIVWGEFGRTPRVNRNSGRDHWPAAGSALIAGGGLRMGQMIGTTSSRGERVVESRYSPSNVLSTIYHAMGIDAAQTIDDNTGRPRHILEERSLVRQLL